jgi:ubiquinone/menaquinone biosynthesis C-methylase UbiE
MVTASPALALFDLIQSHRVTAVIYVAAKLGLAELLREGPQPLSRLAETTGADRRSLERLLRALLTIGVCTYADEAGYALTETGAALDGAAEHSFKAWVIFEGEMLSKSWSGMLESVVTGKTAAELQGLSSSFELMARNPENVKIFNAAMAELTRVVIQDVLEAYDFGPVSHLLDVGGGSGELISAVTKRYQHMRGTVFDLPRCAEAAHEHLKRAGVNGRAAFVAGDFFKEIPAGADAIVLKSVIHDWNDQRSGVILQNCRRALAENGALILIERVMPEVPAAKDEDKSHAMSDLNMMRGPGGGERTEKEYRDLLARSGFRMGSIAPAGRFSVMEARAI